MAYWQKYTLEELIYLFVTFYFSMLYKKIILDARFLTQLKKRDQKAIVIKILVSDSI
jgi:hypothetical protein